jgi:hypothetical protein
MAAGGMKGGGGSGGGAPRTKGTRAGGMNGGAATRTGGGGSGSRSYSSGTGSLTMASPAPTVLDDVAAMSSGLSLKVFRRLWSGSIARSTVERKSKLRIWLIESLTSFRSHHLVDMGLELAGHAAGFLHEAADGAECHRQILGSDHDQRHAGDQGDFRPREIEHDTEQVLGATGALLAPNGGTPNRPPTRSRPDNAGSRRVLEKASLTVVRFVPALARLLYRRIRQDVARWRRSSDRRA